MFQLTTEPSRIKDIYDFTNVDYEPFSRIFWQYLIKSFIEDPFLLFSLAFSKITGLKIYDFTNVDYEPGPFLEFSNNTLSKKFYWGSFLTFFRSRFQKWSPLSILWTILDTILTQKLPFRKHIILVRHQSFLWCHTFSGAIWDRYKINADHNGSDLTKTLQRPKFFFRGRVILFETCFLSKRWWQLLTTKIHLFWYHVILWDL